MFDADDKARDASPSAKARASPATRHDRRSRERPLCPVRRRRTGTQSSRLTPTTTLVQQHRLPACACSRRQHRLSSRCVACAADLHRSLDVTIGARSRLASSPTTILVQQHRLPACACSRRQHRPSSRCVACAADLHRLLDVTIGARSRRASSRTTKPRFLAATPTRRPARLSHRATLSSGKSLTQPTVTVMNDEEVGEYLR